MSFEVVGYYIIRQSIGSALQPARVASNPAAVLNVPSSARSDLRVCGCGPYTLREPSASQDQWSEAFRAGAVFLSSLMVIFVFGLRTHVTPS